MVLSSSCSIYCLHPLNILFFSTLVSISFDNYRTIHPGILESDSTSSDDDLDYEEMRNDKVKQAGGKSSGGSRRKRYQGNGSGKNITTKHDADVCGRKNAQNIVKVKIVCMCVCVDKSFLLCCIE